MSSQIFKKNINNDTLFELLYQISIKTEKYYIVDNISYKKGIFTESIPKFIEECKSYYYLSKRKTYLERNITYNSFITVIRQICNFNNITYTSQIKYDKSKYDIVYHIYF
jgi:hypothetical protein